VPTDHLFAVDGDRLVPSERARGPWDPGSQHGGPVAAVLARAVEQTPSDVPMQVTRLTIELLRPVPLAPVTVTARLIRPGRKVQLVQAVLEAEERELARMTALRIRTAPLVLPEGTLAAGGDLLPAPETLESTPGREGPPAFHNEGVEMRFARGRFDQPGPATVWIRLRQPVVAGEEPTPLQRVAAAADFGNGVSSWLTFDSHLFINPDLTITLHRLPGGEWVALDAVTTLSPDGIGMAESRLHDETGPIGRAVQSLLVEAR
jgi:hypothetical protein